MGKAPVIVWFRQDLRLTDNPAFRRATQSGNPILPLFIWSPDEEKDWPAGGASRWWLHHSLKSLNAALESRTSKLLIRTGNSLEVLQQLVRESGAERVCWNRRYEPHSIKRDKAIKEQLTEANVTAESFNGSLLFEPWTISNKSGAPYQVFTPFWKMCLTKEEPDQPLPTPRSFTSPEDWPDSKTIDDLTLLPSLNWADAFKEHWEPGETGAHRNLRRFIDEAYGDYSGDRNRPDRDGTSRLSPHLHFGEVSPRQIWQALRDAAGGGNAHGNWKRSQFVAEIGWRELAYHLLFHFPQTPDDELREAFKAFPWRDEPEWLKAWQRGRTGYPIVDAGMRQLWTTGWMHNRVRMIVGSFLVKDLMIDWREGAAWFWDTLVDADLASNTLGWQWIAGCGADAAPYFRVFNPVGQGEKFDPNGDYVRRWVPELSKLPTQWVHQPFEAPKEVLADAGVQLGRDYPTPVVNHKIARELALEAYNKIKK